MKFAKLTMTPLSTILWINSENTAFSFTVISFDTLDLYKW